MKREYGKNINLIAKNLIAKKLKRNFLGLIVGEECDGKINYKTILHLKFLLLESDQTSSRARVGPRAFSWTRVFYIFHTAAVCLQTVSEHDCMKPGGLGALLLKFTWPLTQRKSLVSLWQTQLGKTQSRFAVGFSPTSTHFSNSIWRAERGEEGNFSVCVCVCGCDGINWKALEEDWLDLDLFIVSVKVEQSACFNLRSHMPRSWGNQWKSKVSPWRGQCEKTWQACVCLEKSPVNFLET